MSRKRSSDKSELTRAEVEAAMKSLLRKGLIVARTDVNGQVVYFTHECAPPPGPFELRSYRRRIEEEESRSKCP
jgi:hypothetical protein